MKQLVKSVFTTKAQKCLHTDLVSISSPEEFKKVCNTILKKGGTLSLEEKLTEFLDSLIDIYGENVDRVLIEYFGEEFVNENLFHVDRLYKVCTHLDTAKKRGDFLCGCYKSWILEWKIIFPHY